MFAALIAPASDTKGESAQWKCFHLQHCNRKILQKRGSLQITPKCPFHCGDLNSSKLHSPLNYTKRNLCFIRNFFEVKEKEKLTLRKNIILIFLPNKILCKWGVPVL